MRNEHRNRRAAGLVDGIGQLGFQGPAAGLAALAPVDSGLPRHTAASAYLHEKAGDLQAAARLYAEAAQRARDGGAEIVKLLKTGSAYYAPASATIAMAESIIKDKERILPCAAYCHKEYGIGGYFVGVPCVLGSKGVEKVIEIELDAVEKAMFDTSVSHVKELVATVKL